MTDIIMALDFFLFRKSKFLPANTCHLIKTTSFEYDTRDSVYVSELMRILKFT
jgi:hypothetical protein